MHTCYASEKKYDPDICHFLIVLHDKCNLDFEHSKTYKLLSFPLPKLLSMCTTVIR